MTTLTHLKRPIFAPTPRKVSPRLFTVGVGLLLLLLLFKLGLSSAAHLADPLRQLIGNEAVAQLESWLFATQDGAKQLAYAAGLAEPAVPWQAVAVVSPTAIPTPLPVSPTPTPTAQPVPPVRPIIVIENEAAVRATATPLPATATAIPSPTPSPSPIPWSPPLCHPWVRWRGRGPGGGARGNGRISNADNVAGKLLAAFNGGFMATHGEYGAMSDGLEVLPPKDGLATVAIGQDGRIHR